MYVYIIVVFSHNVLFVSGFSHVPSAGGNVVAPPPISLNTFLASLIHLLIYFIRFPFLSLSGIYKTNCCADGASSAPIAFAKSKTISKLSAIIIILLNIKVALLGTKIKKINSSHRNGITEDN